MGRAHVNFKCLVDGASTALDNKPYCKNPKCGKLFANLPCANTMTVLFARLRERYKDREINRDQMKVIWFRYLDKVKIALIEQSHIEQEKMLQKFDEDDESDEDMTPVRETPKKQVAKEVATKINTSYDKHVEHEIRVHLMSFLVRKDFNMAKDFWETCCGFDQWDLYFTKVSSYEAWRDDEIQVSQTFKEYIFKQKVLAFLKSCNWPVDITKPLWVELGYEEWELA
jgi:hypothetical protein